MSTQYRGWYQSLPFAVDSPESLREFVVLVGILVLVALLVVQDRRLMVIVVEDLVALSRSVVCRALPCGNDSNM